MIEVWFVFTKIATKPLCLCVNVCTCYFTQKSQFPVKPFGHILWDGIVSMSPKLSAHICETGGLRIMSGIFHHIITHESSYWFILSLLIESDFIVRFGLPCCPPHAYYICLQWQVVCWAFSWDLITVRSVKGKTYLTGRSFKIMLVSKYADALRKRA